jgi:VanZ family protein
MTRLWWVLGVVIVGLALYVCLAPTPDIPGSFELNDKFSHAAGHALLTIYFTGLVARSRWWKVVVFLTLFGIAVEVAQHFMKAGREAEARDLLANAAGVALGLLLAHFGLCRWPRWVEWLLGRRAAS